MSNASERTVAAVAVAVVVVKNSMILRHKIIHFPTSLGVSEVSEQGNE